MSSGSAGDTARQRDRDFIDAIRACLGKSPLYAPEPPPEPAHSYLHLTHLRALASPSCRTCGGSGYYDGERIDMRCPCTGLQQRTSRSTAPHEPHQGFVYRRRA